MPTTLGERQIAYVVHEVLAAFDRAAGQHAIPWEDVPMNERAAMVNVVRNVRKKPDMQADKHHDAWVLRRRAEGWRWGPVLDREGKAHPNLMLWAELPWLDRAREELMIGTVKCLMHPIPNQG